MPKKTNKKKKSVSFQQDKIAKSSKKKKKSVSTRPRKQIKKTKSKKGKGRLSILDYERSDICHNIFDERLSCFWGGGVSSNPKTQDERENQEMVHNILGIQKEHIATPDDGSRKRKSDEEKGKGSKTSVRVVNQNQVNDWKLRDGEDYITVFRHKVRGGPKLSMGCYGCNKFHNKGWCFTDCDNVASHIELVGDDFKKFDDRVKALRGE